MSVETARSTLLPWALEPLDADDTVTIFDVGPAEAESVTFYNRFRCRVVFADLADDLASWRSLDGEVDRPPDPFSTALLGLGGVRLDVCLFWDFLNRLSPTELAAFAAAISPHVHPDTRAHGYVGFSPRVALAERRYGVLDAQRVAVKPTGCELPHVHGRDQIEHAFGFFSIERATLLTDNRTEMVFSARGR